MICLLKCIHVQADSVILFYVIVIGLRAQIVMIDEFILVINEFIYHCWLFAGIMTLVNLHFVLPNSKLNKQWFVLVIACLS